MSYLLSNTACFGPRYDASKDLSPRSVMVSDDPTEAHMRHGSPVVTLGPECFGTARGSVRPWQESLLAKVEWHRVEPVVEMSKIMITLFFESVLHRFWLRCVSALHSWVNSWPVFDRVRCAAYPEESVRTSGRPVD